MKKIIFAICLITAVSSVHGEPALTIYNQSFAVVRDTVPLDLKPGENNVRFTGATAHVEPDSVILRDPKNGRPLQILEQNYRADPVSQELLLSLYEGKTIDFENVRTKDNTQTIEVIRGKIIRSGYVPHYAAMSRYDESYYGAQMAMVQGGGGQPIIEVDGKLRFGLPGLPIFPSLGDDTILMPTLNWLIKADKGGKSDAEVSYVSGGFNWVADYNLVAPAKGDTLDLIGWITMDNQSGRTFENAKIKLMAGDVQKLQPASRNRFYARAAMMDSVSGVGGAPVTEKTFDEFHLYTLARSTTLHDRETKQVEFVRASGIVAPTVYVYDGAKIDQNRYGGWGYDSIRNERDYGTLSNPKVWVMREFTNSDNNHLGMPLPKGKLRFYRRNDDGQMEFTGEDLIDHTPHNEMIRVSTGNSFDLTGQRKRTFYKQDSNNKWLDESFDIKLHNHKKQPVDIRVVEHLYRWSNWQIADKSTDFVKIDAQTIEFHVSVKPEEEKSVSYTAHYSW